MPKLHKTAENKNCLSKIIIIITIREDNNNGNGNYHNNKYNKNRQ